MQGKHLVIGLLIVVLIVVIVLYTTMMSTFKKDEQGSETVFTVAEQVNPIENRAQK